MAIYEHAFQSMASPIRIRLDFPGNHQREYAEAATEIWDMAEAEFASVVKALSRFDPNSELSRLNRSPGQWVAVSPLLREALQKAREAYEYTDGVFDPRILRSLEALGYTGAPVVPLSTGGRGDGTDSMRGAAASFDSDGEKSPEPGADPAPWVEFHGDRVRIEAPLDLGGLGKSLAVDRVRKGILSHPAARQMKGFLVNAGGDLYAWGTREDGEHWRVGIEDPTAPTTILAALDLPVSTAVCTSSIARRRWIHHGRPVHHLIDPATGQPAESAYLSVTCAYPDPITAEIITKALFIRPAQSLRIWPWPDYIWWVTTDVRLLATPSGQRWVTWSR